ncbi:MAG: hypothetical protein HY574_03780 [candidate division NC10 bacterium]|nr:hypothetical protein [candidate division NC10 bacterium]
MVKITLITISAGTESGSREKATPKTVTTHNERRLRPRNVDSPDGRVMVEIYTGLPTSKALKKFDRRGRR